MPADTSPQLPSHVLVSLHGPCASVPAAPLLQIFPWGGGGGEGSGLNLRPSLLCSGSGISQAGLHSSLLLFFPFFLRLVLIFLLFLLHWVAVGI